MDNKKQQQQQPIPSVYNSQWKYTPASSTNVLARFKAMGWVPPSEEKKRAFNS
jgi:hypothetical protein